ncbi:MAG: hypothetical protein HXX10_22850 [Rhodoplanes sp.]|uniref:hypothetical protein n=1 Tax=Rhodoplanes sp. TaxID=1968906 RepID=UPI0017A8DB1E|nr:hypothetical protein [Rhodoplanes sp.]NVO16874.1 hypothetical protein [Rhodoplanes sp.]
MRDLFASGRIVDVILTLVVVEAIALAGYRRLTGRGLALRTLAANLLAGGFLLLAVRAALVGAEWIWVAASLLAALLAHVADLTARLTTRPVPSSRTS